MAVDLNPGGLRDITSPSQPASDDLLAQELRPKSPHAEDVGDRIGIPTLRQHGNADHAFHVLAQLAGLTYCIHDLAQQIFIRQFLGITTGETHPILSLEFFDLHFRDLLEFIAHGLAAFELRAVNEYGIGAAEPLALFDVAEDGELARNQDRLVVAEFLFPP